MKKIILIFFASVLGLSLVAQETPKKTEKADRKSEKKQKRNAIMKQEEEEGTLSFNKQSAFGVQLRTNGYGIFYELGKRRSPRFANLYTIEITEIKHKKEEKSDKPSNFFGNAFVYGKQNNFYQAKLGFGQQYIIGQKGNRNGVAITLNTSAGVDLGFLKPYYLKVIDSFGNEKTINYEQDSTAFLSPGSIIGSGGFFKGWNQLKFKPGIFLKTAVRFDFGRYNEKVQALEVGMSLEAFAQKIPIMIGNTPKQLFFQGHVAFVFGSRKR